MAWNTILRNWAPGKHHHLQDAQVIVDPQLPWERVAKVEAFSQEMWENGLRLSDIIEDLDDWIWQEQKMEYTQYQRFRQGFQFFIGTILLDYICVVRVDKRNVADYLRVFHSADRQKLRVAAGLPLEMGYVMGSPPPRNPIIFVHVEMRYPSLQDLVFTAGIGKVLFEYQAAHETYAFCVQSSGRLLDIPTEIRMAWWSKILLVEEHRDYLSESYYSTNSLAYSQWSFEAHRRQLVEVLSQLDQKSVLVAPGDGIGIVASIWKGTVIAGDKFYSSERVKKETFLETMVRGRRASSSAILVLSYVTTLMSEIELHSAKNWPGPVIWIDSSDQCPITNTEHCGRNFFVRGLVYPTFHSTEYFETRNFVKYTENLLGLPQISYIEVKNEAVLYWEQMRPLARSVVSNDETMDIPVVAMTLKDWYFARERGRKVYFAPLGKSIDKSIDIRLCTIVSLSYREIYRIPSSHPLALLISENCSYYFRGLELYFCSKRMVPHQFTLSLKQFKTKFSFVALHPQQPLLSRFVSQRGHSFEIHTVHGLLTLDIDNVVQWRFLELYLDAFCEEDWRKKTVIVPMKLLAESDANVLRLMQMEKRRQFPTPIGFLPMWVGEKDGEFSSWDVWK